MSGGGGYPAGYGPAGADPIQTTSGTIYPPRRTLHFDIGSKSFPRDPVTGLLIETHWVDQAVNLALGVQFGALKGQPTLGNKLAAIPRGDALARQAAGRNEVRYALKDLIKRKDIGVLNIDIDTSMRGRLLAVVLYINLRTNTQVLTKFSFSA